MSADQDEDKFFSESDYSDAPDEVRDGPPDDFDRPSYFNIKDRGWWVREDGTWRRDRCPARPRGFINGEYIFVTPIGEVRTFKLRDLYQVSGLPDLFVHQTGWLWRHFRKYDLEKKMLVGPVLRHKAAHHLMIECTRAKYAEGGLSFRKTGTWRSSDGLPIVHAGDRIFHAGEIFKPGDDIDDIIYVLGGKREAPSLELTRDGRGYGWLPVSPAIGCTVTAHLDEWVWDTPEARELFQGGLHCDMLCCALVWLSHRFILAPLGSGKSSLLQYARMLLGGGAHDVQKSYTKGYLEQGFGAESAPFLLDEAESDEDGGRLRHIFELVRLLSDHGGKGGRGSPSGQTRKIDVNGTVTMAATMTEEWKPQDRSRITLLELRPFSDRGDDRPPTSPEQLEANLKTAAGFSPGLRARALATWELFQRNLKIARAAILEMGGLPRDADQLGHLIAGWKTMTSDEPLGELDELARFRPFIASLTESEEGEDAPNDLLNVLFSAAPDVHRGGDRLTVGQILARARAEGADSDQYRRALPAIGMRLERVADEKWDQAWLWIATKHGGLDRLFPGHPSYRGIKRSQILRQLRRKEGSDVLTAKRSHKTARFGGAQSHYLLIPPGFLPSEADG